MIRGHRFLVPILLLAVSAFGQETRATLSGTVTDPSGASLAGASLRLANVQTGGRSYDGSEPDGPVSLPVRQPGHVPADRRRMAGFRNLIREGIQLETGQGCHPGCQFATGRPDGGERDRGRGSSLIEAEKADRGMVVARVNVAELPIITRTPVLLATLAPGVTNTAVRYDWTPFSNSWTHHLVDQRQHGVQHRISDRRRAQRRRLPVRAQRRLRAPIGRGTGVPRGRNAYDANTAVMAAASSAW